ncbi:MAG: tetratricopeptide repeat protein [Microcoleaceae cyanobacterium]
MKKNGCVGAAITNYQKAIFLQPDDSSNYSNLGLIFLEIGEIVLGIPQRDYLDSQKLEIGIVYLLR